MGARAVPGHAYCTPLHGQVVMQLDCCCQCAAVRSRNDYGAFHIDRAVCTLRGPHVHPSPSLSGCASETAANARPHDGKASGQQRRKSRRCQNAGTLYGRSEVRHLGVRCSQVNRKHTRTETGRTSHDAPTRFPCRLTRYGPRIHGADTCLVYTCWDALHKQRLV